MPTIDLVDIGDYQFIVRRTNGVTTVHLEAGIVDEDGHRWATYGPVERTAAMSAEDAAALLPLIASGLAVVREAYNLEPAQMQVSDLMPQTVPLAIPESDVQEKHNE